MHLSLVEKYFKRFLVVRNSKTPKIVLNVRAKVFYIKTPVFAVCYPGYIFLHLNMFERSYTQFHPLDVNTLSMFQFQCFLLLGQRAVPFR